MRKIILTLACLQVTMTALFAQSNELPKLIPPSPNAAALQRYGDIPVSTYTGVPNISIPIHEVQSGDVKLPISISYHASGIRVADEASRVGLGWALNAGGVITRQIMGKDDYAFTGFNYHGVPNAPEFNDIDYFKGTWFYAQEGCSVTGLPGSPDMQPYLQEDYDFQPDIYTFNFSGYTGKFMLRRNKAVVLGQKQKIQVNPPQTESEGWSIISPDGTKYFFDEYEAYTDPVTGAPLARKSAWYLTRIVSPENKTVWLDYQINTLNIKTAGSFTEYRDDQVFSDADAVNGCPGILAAPTFPHVKQENPRTEYRNVALTKIRFDLGEVIFIYGTGREDVENDLRLDSIRILSKNPDGSVVKIIRQWKFNYSYFEGTSDNDYSLVGLPAAGIYAKRLKLLSLQEWDEQAKSIPPYLFTYNQEGQTSSTLPAKSSFARDHWGYWNGNASNLSLIPIFTQSNSNNIVSDALGIMGPERNANPLFTGLWSLREIKYPTSGRTEFEFESNTYDIMKSNANDKSYYNKYPETGSKTLQAFYVADYTGPKPDISQPIFPPEYVLDLRDLYTSPDETTSQVSLSAFFRFDNPQPGCLLNPYIGKITIRLKDFNGNVYGTSDLVSALGTFATCNPQGQGITFSNQYALQPGFYYWEVTLEPNAGLDALLQDISLTVNYTTRKDASSITYEGITMKGVDYGGGLRIKRLKDFDDQNLAPKIKRFVYHDYFAGTIKSIPAAISYGKRMSRPVYGYFEKGLNSISCIIGANSYTFVLVSAHLIRESESNYPLNGSASGQLVGYDKVSILYGENGEFGKTTAEYENEPDLILDFSRTSKVYNVNALQPRKPPAISTVSNFGNGNLLTQTEFEWTGVDFRPVRKTVNTYTSFKDVTPAWLGIEKRTIKGNYNLSSNCYVETFIYPAIVQDRKLMTESAVTSYDRVNGSPLTQISKQTYDLNTHLQLVEQSVSVSRGESMKTRYRYPLDFLDSEADPAIMEMKGIRFMHAVPVQKTNTLVKSDGTQLQTGGEITKYQITNGFILPAETAIFETNTGSDPATIPLYQPISGTYPSGYATRIQYNQYDAYGNILQVQKKDDAAKSYVWDYLGNYPIAEVINAKASEIAYTSFETGETGNWTLGSTQRNDNALTGTKSYVIFTGNTISRTGLTAGKQYIISYWSKNGALTITGSTTRTGNVRNGWTLYEHTITPSGTTITLTSSSRRVIDELRLYPATAQMTTYTYDPLVGMTSTCTPNNIISYYVYDGFNRLTSIRDFEGNIVKTFEYKYKQ